MINEAYNYPKTSWARIIEPFERIFNSKLLNYFTLLLTLLMAMLLLFVPYYISKSLQIEIPKGINYAIIFVYGYLVVKIINSYFYTTSEKSNNISEKDNNIFADDINYELQRKIYKDFSKRLHDS